MHRGGTLLAGRYRVVRQIGAGGMGTVHLAHDETLGRDVAVKSVHAAPESEHGRRIMREARLGAALRHPHLVTVFDVRAEDGALLLVMEYVEGETLADALRRGPLEPARAIAVLRAVAAALDHAHAQGIVHRDVKPANILLGSGGTVKLADLGIATADHVTRITRTGGALGTVAYMAPEQFGPGRVKPAADVYALAAVAFEALSGRRPYPGATAFEVFTRLREGASPPDVRELRPDLPERVGEVLRHGMATEPSQRPAHAGELVDALEAALTTTPPRPPEIDPTQPLPAASEGRRRRRRRRRALIVPFALVAVGGVVAAILVGSGDGDEPARRTSAATATTATAEPREPARATSGPPTPEDAVRAFYTRAADGDLAGAWRLAGPKMRAAFGNDRDTFEADLGSLRAIAFRRLAQTEATATTATVAIETVAEHTDRTDRCTGTVQTVKNRRGRWLVEPLGVRCVSS
ncbi:MAG TPA: serine/threonine-protein kinase [Solirubrobacteraceae bacterium]|jgi:serine/threonine-protein kinase